MYNYSLYMLLYIFGTLLVHLLLHFVYIFNTFWHIFVTFWLQGSCVLTGIPRKARVVPLKPDLQGSQEAVAVSAQASGKVSHVQKKTYFIRKTTYFNRTFDIINYNTWVILCLSLIQPFIY